MSKGRVVFYYDNDALVGVSGPRDKPSFSQKPWTIENVGKVLPST